MKLHPEETAKIRGAMAALQKALDEANAAPNTFEMRQRLSTLRAATNRADAIILDVETSTRRAAIEALEGA